VKDDMMRIYQKRFSYFMGPNSFYPEKIIKSDPPNTASRATKQSVASKGSGDKDEDKSREEAMREFVREYSRGVRQENVRSKTGNYRNASICLEYEISCHYSLRKS
jgi:hypothetical protein